MSLEVRQLVLRARVQEDADEDEDDNGAAASRKDQGGCGAGGEDDACEDKESLKEEILADCRAWLLEQLRSLRER